MTRAKPLSTNADEATERFKHKVATARLAQSIALSHCLTSRGYTRAHFLASALHHSQMIDRMLVMQTIRRERQKKQAAKTITTTTTNSITSNNSSNSKGKKPTTQISQPPPEPTQQQQQPSAPLSLVDMYASSLQRKPATANANGNNDGSGSASMGRLDGSRFRWLNEVLYTDTGDAALDLFSREPNLFDEYHKGFRAQVEKWPVNPLDSCVEWLTTKVPRTAVVGDFGCGEAELSLRVPQTTVHSFDLVAANERITACDIANVPLENESLDVAVFCLSLMGTNVGDFVREANRVLKIGGLLKVAEVKSRFESEKEFAASLSKLGFKLVNMDMRNKMFVVFDFKKVSSRVNKKLALTLKPCLYKRR